MGAVQGLGGALPVGGARKLSPLFACAPDRPLFIEWGRIGDDPPRLHRGAACRSARSNLLPRTGGGQGGGEPAYTCSESSLASPQPPPRCGRGSLLITSDSHPKLT